MAYYWTDEVVESLMIIVGNFVAVIDAFIYLFSILERWWFGGQ